MSEPPDPTRCPLCGESNACARAAAPAGCEPECWCSALRFDAALLACVPAASAGRACICQRCQRAAAGAAEPG
jgi:hypothetical protein